MRFFPRAMLVVVGGESGVVGEEGGLDPVGEPELAEDPAEVGLHGGLAEVQPPGDVGVGEPVGECPQDLAFLAGEAVDQLPCPGLLPWTRHARRAPPRP